MKLLIQAGLKATEDLWPTIKQAYALVHQAAHVLANAEQHEEAAIKREYESLLEIMRRQQDQLGDLSPAVDHFCKVTAIGSLLAREIAASFTYLS